MAKQTVGPIVRHLEKAVLAASAGVFLYIVATHGVVSPSKLGPEGQKMGPAELDNQARVQADNLRDKLLRATPSPSPVPDPMPRLVKASDPLDLAGVEQHIPRPVQFGLPIPIFSRNIGVGRTADLIEVVKLSKPEIGLQQQGRSGVFLVPPAAFHSGTEGGGTDQAFLQDINWITVSTLFDRQEMERRCRQAQYDHKRVETVFLGADVEKRVQLADGGFSDWVPVKATSLRDRPTLPVPEVYEADQGGFNVSDEQRSEVEKFFEMIHEDDNQLSLLRPFFPETSYGSEWRFPRSAEFDVLRMDADYQDTPRCRYPEFSTFAERINPKARARDLLTKAEEELDREHYDFALAYAQAAQDKADRDADEAKNVITQIQNAQAAAGTRRRAPLGTQLLWAHDAGIGSVRSGRTYQYRMRARVYNRYCGTPPLLNDPYDAERVELVGPWSDPSDPITVPLDEVIILKSSREAKGECKVEIFKWVAGVWVMKPFNVKVGEHIGDEARVDTPRTLRDVVNFDSGAMVVDIDFNRPYRSRSKKGGRLGPMTETVALTHVDSTGQLHESLLDLDKNSQTYKDFKSRIWKPRKR